MRMYVLPTEFSGEPRLQIEGKEAHYLIRVLRMKDGFRFAGRDKNGSLWDLEMISHGKGTCVLACRPAGAVAIESADTLPSYDGPLPELHLYQCLCKGKKMEQIVRQATEIGACRIIPVQSKHSVVDLSKKESDELEFKRDRLQSIVKEAIQQSGSSIMTLVDKTLAFHDIVGDWDGRGLALFFHQNCIMDQKSLVEIVSSYAREKGPEAPIAIVVGPEGGISDDEVQFLLQSGFNPVLLKTNILRAETAATFALAAIQTLMLG
jgi:16S rRNA (uracil1498-N3)-methyltransferase